MKLIPPPPKKGIIIIAYNISHCGAQPRSLNVYWACRQPRPISVKFRDKAPVNFSNLWLETWGEKCKAERSSPALLIPEQKYQQGSARHTAALRSGRNQADLSPPRARRRLVPTAPIIFFSAFLYSSTLWPYPRRGSDPKAKEQSKRGTLPQRRAQSPASLGDREVPVQGLSHHRTLLTQLGQDSPWTAPETCLQI